MSCSDLNYIQSKMALLFQNASVQLLPITKLESLKVFWDFAINNDFELNKYQGFLDEMIIIYLRQCYYYIRLIHLNLLILKNI